MKLTGGGRYEPGEEFIYFAVGGPKIERVAQRHPWCLLALNDLAGKNGVRTAQKAKLDGCLEAGAKVLLDSGIFWLTNEHKRAHNVTMDEALALPPDQIDGFDWLLENYLGLVKEYEADLWGYIELDQGGAENKRKTRALLEAEGLRPIPVYHPLVDGWDYFDELASGYDRICLGNVVQAERDVRRHLLATLWERRRKHPHLWVHVLGITPNEITTVYPVSSCDSSSMVYALRYGTRSAPGGASMGKQFSRFDESFTYRLGEDDYHYAGVDFLAAEVAHYQNTVREQQRGLEREFGAGACLPPVDDREEVRA